MRALIVGPCVSEFGWELMEWQGYVRKQAAGILPGNIVISTTQGLKPLYSDFAEHFVPHVIRCDRDGHKPRSGKVENKQEVDRVETILDNWERVYKEHGYEVIRLRSWVKRPQRRKIADQKFVPYGAQREQSWKLVIHARNRVCSAPFAGDNYPIKSWNKLIEQIYLKKIVQPGEIVAIGSQYAALAPEGVVNKLGIQLQETMDILASAQLVIGPSSGPMHLASLCRTPHATWATSRFQSLISGGNKARYEKDWNPFQTPVEVLLHKKGVVVPPSQITAVMTKLIYSVYKKDRL